MSLADDQQFCLRWNNFQANITSQFETLRDDEDFTDVTIACQGQRLQAHKVVLSACSPFFKELFKTNPCPHPIIFMRDVEAQDIVALMEFMYAGEVNVAQAHLSTFLRTAESLKIRGLTDTATINPSKEKDEDTIFANPKPSSSKQHLSSALYAATKQRSKSQISSTSTVTSSQDVPASTEKPHSPPPKKQCKNERIIETDNLSTLRELPHEQSPTLNQLASQSDDRNGIGDDLVSKSPLHPKIELPDYLSDDDGDETVNFFHSGDVAEMSGGIEIIPQHSSTFLKDTTYDPNTGLRSFKRMYPRTWSPGDSYISEQLEANSNNGAKYVTEINERINSGPMRHKLVKLGDGIEIFEDQLRSVKWSDYRKLTRGLATILFSPGELATCSVTGQRWSRAGSAERPVKPALDKAKVQAIISYVATRFPMVEISRIKQVLAYKCKENSTALKMKGIRYYDDAKRQSDK